MPNFVPEFPVQWTSILSSASIPTSTLYEIGPTNDLTIGLTNYWKLDDPAGTIWLDSVANQPLRSTNGGTVQSVAGKLNNAAGLSSPAGYTLDSQNATGFTMNTTGTWAVSFWFYFVTQARTDAGYPLCEIVLTPDTGAFTSEIQYTYVANASTLDLFIREGTQSSAGAESNHTTVATDTWHHLVFMGTTDTYSGTNTGPMKLYINNSLVGACTLNATLAFSLFQIGVDGAIAGVDGKIDGLGIWDRSLTASQISSLYNSGSGLDYPFSYFDNTGYSYTQFSFSCTYGSTATNGLNIYVLDDFDGNGNFLTTADHPRKIIMPVTANSTTNISFTVSGYQTKRFMLAIENTSGSTVTVNAKMQRVPVVVQNG